MKNAAAYRRLLDALDGDKRSEEVRHGRCRSTLRGTESERLRLRQFIQDLHSNRGVNNSRTEIRRV